MKFSKNKKLEKYIGEEIIDFLKKKGLYDLYYFNLEQYFNKIIKDCNDTLPSNVSVPIQDNCILGTKSEILNSVKFYFYQQHRQKIVILSFFHPLSDNRFQNICTAFYTKHSSV